MQELDRATILRKTEVVIEKIPVPEWNGFIHIRMLTASERDTFEAGNSRIRKDGKTEPNLKNYRARLLQAAACKANGEPLFGPDDINALGDLGSRGVDRVIDRIQKLNGMREPDLEEAEKNSETTPSAST